MLEVVVAMPESPTNQAPAEETVVHARLLRLALGVEESRAYWEHVDPNVAPDQRPMIAFEERWFGAKSLERIRFLLPNFAHRYDGHRAALEVLRRWRSMDPSTRQAVCHVHLQLSDPLYRRYTGVFLVERRGLSEPKVDRDATLRWVKSTYPDRWADSTNVQFASKLLSAASEAGLVSAKRDPRALLYPKVPDLALEYVLYLLRETRIEGTLVDNLYLASLGLTDGFLDQRIAKLPNVRLHRMGLLFEFEWAHPSLTAWAEATL
jgi:hypothetical protein